MVIESNASHPTDVAAPAVRRPLVRPRRPVSVRRGAGPGARRHHAAVPRPARPPHVDRSGPGPRATDHGRRRLVAAALGLVVFATVVVGLGVLTGSGGDPASASGAPSASTPRRVIAQPGDTLWELAARHRGAVGFDRYLHALIEENDGTAIVAGQTVRLP